MSLTTSNLVSMGLVRKLSERSGIGTEDLNRSVNSVPAGNSSVTPHQRSADTANSSPESFLQFGSEEDIVRNARVFK